MEVKYCNKCRKTKPLSEFSKDKKSKDGLKAYCKECASKYFKAWRINNIDSERLRNKKFITKNPEKKKQYDKKYYTKNIEKRKTYLKNYYIKNSEHIRNRVKLYEKNNPEKVKKTGKLWREKNKEYKRQMDKIYGAKYYKNNIDRIREYTKKWRIENPDKNTAKSSKRRASKIKATPKWLTKQQLAEIANIYKQAKQLEKETGLKYHVDHIIPLKGKDVCGLHVPWNLQVLKAEENIRKGNKL